MELLKGFNGMHRDADATGQMEALDRFGQKAWTVEAGGRLVTVDLRWWDAHVNRLESLHRAADPGAALGHHDIDSSSPSRFWAARRT